jgi:hypothetical protein
MSLEEVHLIEPMTSFPEKVGIPLAGGEGAGGYPLIMASDA